MVKKTLFAGTSFIVVLALAIFAMYNTKGILFHSMPWLMVGATVLGIMSGIFRGMRHNTRLKRLDSQADRHTIDSFLEHWFTAAGILVLIISGFFINFGYRRIFSMNLHFLGLIIALYFGTYFLAHFFVTKKYSYLLPNITDIIEGTIKKYLFRAKWKDNAKYLSSQKSAFLFFSLLGIGLLITGAIKVTVFYFSVPLLLNHSASQIHDLLTVLLAVMVLIHVLLAVAVRSHRRLLYSFFTGKVTIKE